MNWYIFFLRDLNGKIYNYEKDNLADLAKHSKNILQGIPPPPAWAWNFKTEYRHETRYGNLGFVIWAR